MEFEINGTFQRMTSRVQLKLELTSIDYVRMELDLLLPASGLQVLLPSTIHHAIVHEYLQRLDNLIDGSQEAADLISQDEDVWFRVGWTSTGWRRSFICYRMNCPLADDEGSHLSQLDLSLRYPDDCRGFVVMCGPIMCEADMPSQLRLAWANFLRLNS